MPVGRGAKRDPKGLAVEDGVLLLEREIERPLEAWNDWRLRACARLLVATRGDPAGRGYRPRAGDLSRRLGENIGPENLMTDSLASIDEKQRRALLALTALPGVPFGSAPLRHRGITTSSHR